MAGLDRVPVVIKAVTDEAAIAIGLIENIQREDLNPVEEGLGLKRLQDEFGFSQEQVATRGAFSLCSGEFTALVESGTRRSVDA